MSRSLHLPIVVGGRASGGSVEIAAALPLVLLPEHLQWLGFRLTTTNRGRLAVERLH